MDIDVHSYQDELDTIVNDARAVIARMDEVKDRFDQVAGKVTSIEQELNEAKSTVEQRVAETSAHVETFYSGAQGQMGQWDAQVTEAFGKAMNDLVAKLTSLEALFEQKSTEAYAAIDKSHGVLQQVGDIVKGADHDVADGVRSGVHMMQDHLADLKQKFDGTTQPAMTTLDDFLHHTMEQAEATTNEQHDHLEQLKQQVDDHIHQQLFDPIHVHVGDVGQALTQIASGDVDAKLNEIMENARQHLEDQGKQVIGNLVDKVANELDQVSQHLHDAGQQSTLPREVMKPVLDEIEALIKPLEETVNSVKSVAAAVGFDV